MFGARHESRRSRSSRGGEQKLDAGEQKLDASEQELDIWFHRAAIVAVEPNKKRLNRCARVVSI